MKLTIQVLGKYCGSVGKKYYLTFFKNTSKVRGTKTEKNEKYLLVLNDKEKTHLHITLQLLSEKTGKKLFDLYFFSPKVNALISFIDHRYPSYSPITLLVLKLIEILGKMKIIFIVIFF